MNAVWLVTFRSQRQKLHAISQIVRFRGLGDEFKVAVALADGDGKLMGVDDSGESTVFALPEFGFGKQVVVLAEQNPPQFTRPVEQAVVRPCGRAVFLRRDCIHPANSQAIGNRLPHMDVHVERDTHGLPETLPRRTRSGESTVAAAFSRLDSKLAASASSNASR